MTDRHIYLFSGKRATVTRTIGSWSDGARSGPIVNAWIGDQLIRHIHAQQIGGDLWQVAPGESAVKEVA